jgi:hypothetical protein
MRRTISGSTALSPSMVLTTIGKKQTRATTITLGTMVKQPDDQDGGYGHDRDHLGGDQPG